MLMVAVTVSGGEVILSEPFQTQQDLKGWRLAPGAGVAVAPDGKNALKITCGDTTGKSIFTCGYRFDPKTVAGRRLTVTVEVMRDLTPPSVKWQGGKFQLAIKTPKKQDWEGVYMVFEDDTYRTCLKKGELPLLLETGVFRAALNNRNAEKLKLYALGLDGKRIAELPLVKSPGRIEFEVDTAKIPNGPAIYFELAAD